jgi:hypothetical protein
MLLSSLQAKLTTHNFSAGISAGALTDLTMLRLRIKALLICASCSSMLVLVLYFLSGWMVSHPNGFLRKLPTHQIKGIGCVKLENKYYYIAGNDQSTLYLGSRLHRSKVMAVRIPVKDTFVIKITGLDTVKVSSGAYLKSDSSNFYVLDAGKPAILSGKTDNGRLIHICPTPHFTGALPLSSSSAVLATIEKGRREALVKFSDKNVSSPYFLDEQGEGLFSTDGMIVKAPAANRLFFIFYYRNQVLCLDTNLNTLYKSKTIDTNGHVQINVGQISSENALTLSTPPAYVNRHCAANNRWLFVQSALKADNEVASAMGSVSVFDVYAINDGRYRLSFYISDFDHEKVRDFRVCGNTLVALFDHYVYLYQLYF